MRNIDTIHIELTNRCNLNCNYCYQKYRINGITPKDNAFGELEFDVIKNSPIFSVNLTGGEPTLDARLPILAKAFSSNGKNVTVTTNGIKRIESLEHIHTIIVSVDGFFTEMNLNRNIKPYQYELITNNILYYLENGKSVQLNLVVTKYNLHQFGNFIRTNQFGNRLSYSIIVVSDKTLDRNFIIDSSDDYNFIENEIVDIYKFFNYHIQLRSNLMTKSSFIDTFSEEYPITFFATYSVSMNRYAYINKEFKRFDDLYQNYDVISQMITEKIIRRLGNLDSNDWFNPYSWAEIVHDNINGEV